MKPLVSIIIVTYKGRQLLETFTPTVAAQDYPNLEFIVVDNASNDGSAEWIKKTYPKWKVIENPKNDGTAEGSNVGARQAKGDLIFWISNDMWFEKDCVSKLVALMESDESIGIATCKMRRITPELEKLNVIDSVGAEIDFLGGPDAIGIHQEDRGQFDRVRDVFFSFGGAMMIRKSLFDATQGYDPETFTLADDIDLSWRVRLLGYKVCAEPGAVLYHRVSATLSKVDRGQRRFWSERNTLRMILKNYAWYNLLWILPVYDVLLIGELLFYAVMLRWDIGRRVLEAVAWNFSHFEDTMRQREIIQRGRKVGDRNILAIMKKMPWKLSLGLNFLRDPQSSDWKNFWGKPKDSAG